MGPTMDREIVRTLFGETIAAAQALNVDADLRQRLAAMRRQIAPLQIGKHGQLQEWMEDIDDPKNQHRHVSHLWAVFPGSEVTPYGTPDLFQAARQSLVFRGDAATGWSMEIGRASCRERGEISGVPGSLKKKKDLTRLRCARVRFGATHQPSPHLPQAHC